MLHQHNRFFTIALRSVAFASASLVFAACGGGGGGLTPQTPSTSNVQSPSQPISGATAASATSSYAATVMGDTPTAYYHLDDTGSIAADASGNGLNGTIGASVSKSAAGLLGSSSDKAVAMPGINGASGVIRVAQNAKLQPSSAVSVELLLSLASRPTNYREILGYGNDAQGSPYELYLLPKTAQLVAQFKLSSGYLKLTTPTGLNPNTAYHIVMTFNGSTGALYVDGALRATASKSGTLAGYISGLGLGIGTDAAFSEPAFQGTLDEVAVYANKALTAAQVLNHYDKSIGQGGSNPGPTPTPAPTANPTANPVPTPTPVSTPVPPPPSGGVATFDGCPVFTAGDYYNANVASAALDPHSASYISAAMSAGNTSGFWASTGEEFVNIATSSTPKLTVHPQVSYHQFPVPYPWQSSFKIEPAGDAHAVVLDTSTCHLYESYSTHYSGGSLSAYSGANWDLRTGFKPLASGPSAMASGLSIFAGMVKWEEVQSGAIHHALNWEAPAHTVGNGIYVHPASDAESYTFNGSGYALPYGAHLRLKASFNISNFPPQARIVAQAMKTYGIFLSDTGSYGNGLYFANALNGSDPWNSSDLNALGNLKISDFEVLPVGTVNHI